MHTRMHTRMGSYAHLPKRPPIEKMPRMVPHTASETSKHAGRPLILSMLQKRMAYAVVLRADRWKPNMKGDKMTVPACVRACVIL